MLCSTEHEINHAHTVKMPIIVDILNHSILTFTSMINTTSESLKARKGFSLQHFVVFMSSLNCRLDLVEYEEKLYSLETRMFFSLFSGCFETFQSKNTCW